MAELGPDSEEAGVWESSQQLQATDSGARTKYWRASLHTPTQQRRQSLLSQAIEAEVLPRLLLARRSGPQPIESPSGPPDERVLEMVRLVLADDEDAPGRYVDALAAAGLSVETICLELLAPAARHLGDLWLADLCDFTTVTIASWQLQRILRTLADEFHASAARRRDGANILLVPIFGEQHTLGLQMVAAFFSRAGWAVTCLPLQRRVDLVSMVRCERFAVVGMSLAGETFLGEAASCVRSVRANSLNPRVGVMVGGPIFNQHPEFVAQVGADTTAADARTAPIQAQRLLEADRPPEAVT